MQAMAKITTSVAERQRQAERRCSTNGSTTSATAAISRGHGRLRHRRLTRTAGCVRRTGRAGGTAAPAASADRSTPRAAGGIDDSMVTPAHDADQQRRRRPRPRTSRARRSPPRRRPAVRISCAHRRMDGGDRRQQHAGETREPDAERRDRRHVGLRARCRARRPCRGSARRRAPRGRTAVRRAAARSRRRQRARRRASSAR